MISFLCEPNKTINKLTGEYLQFSMEASPTSFHQWYEYEGGKRFVLEHGEKKKSNTSNLTIVDDNTIAIFQTLLEGNFLGGEEQVT